MIVTVHQPEHLPWLGFFDKAIRADMFVLLDCVQFRKDYYQNRNKIRTKNGWAWITLPVKKPLIAPIHEVQIDIHSPLTRRYLNIIQAHYLHSPFFKDYFPTLRELLLSKRERLFDVNYELIRFAFEALGIKTPIMIASKLGILKEKGGTDLNLAICKLVGAKTYLSGISGKTYLDENKFDDNGICVRYQEFRHPIYRQLHEPFLPCMSVVDLFFNYGEESISVMNGIGVSTMDCTFE